MGLDTKENGESLPCADEGARLLVAHKSGDVTAFAQLDNLYGYQAKMLAWKITGDEHIAEDMVHEAWMSILKNDTFDPTKKFAPFFYTAVTHKCHDYFRRKKSRLGEYFFSQASNGTDTDPQDIAHDMGREREVIQDQVDQLLAELRPKEAQTLRLVFLEECSRSDAARILGVNPETITNRINRVRQKKNPVTVGS